MKDDWVKVQISGESFLIAKVETRANASWEYLEPTGDELLASALAVCLAGIEHEGSAVIRLWDVVAKMVDNLNGYRERNQRAEPVNLAIDQFVKAANGIEDAWEQQDKERDKKDNEERYVGSGQRACRSIELVE